jgi:hypothetical protein
MLKNNLFNIQIINTIDDVLTYVRSWKLKMFQVCTVVKL